MARDAELHARDLLGGHLERDVFGMVDEDAVPTVGQVKRDVLVGLLAAGAAVFVPAVHHLAVLEEGGEALAEAIHVFSHP